MQMLRKYIYTSFIFIKFNDITIKSFVRCANQQDQGQNLDAVNANLQPDNSQYPKNQDSIAHGDDSDKKYWNNRIANSQIREPPGLKQVENTSGFKFNNDTTPTTNLQHRDPQRVHKIQSGYPNINSFSNFPLSATRPETKQVLEATQPRNSQEQLISPRASVRPPHAIQQFERIPPTGNNIGHNYIPVHSPNQNTTSNLYQLKNTENLKTKNAQENKNTADLKNPFKDGESDESDSDETDKTDEKIISLDNEEKEENGFTENIGIYVIILGLVLIAIGAIIFVIVYKK